MPNRVFIETPGIFYRNYFPPLQITMMTWGIFTSVIESPLCNNCTASARRSVDLEEVDLEAQDSMLVKGGESVGRYQAKLEEDLDKIEVQNQVVSVNIENESPKAPSRRSRRGNESKDFSSENDFDLDMISERKPEESQVITTVDDNLQIQQSLHQSRTSAQE